MSCPPMAFRLSGRLRVMRATPSGRFSKRRSACPELACPELGRRGEGALVGPAFRRGGGRGRKPGGRKGEKGTGNGGAARRGGGCGGRGAGEGGKECRAGGSPYH